MSAIDQNARFASAPQAATAAPKAALPVKRLIVLGIAVAGLAVGLALHFLYPVHVYSLTNPAIDGAHSYTIHVQAAASNAANLGANLTGTVLGWIFGVLAFLSLMALASGSMVTLLLAAPYR